MLIMKRPAIYFDILYTIIFVMILTARGIQRTDAENLAEQSEDNQMNLLRSDSMNSFETDETPSRNLNEEKRYWIDHEERITELENPTRRFVEIRAVNTKWEGDDDEGEHVYFGMLKEADYVVSVSDDGPELAINFTFSKEPLEAGYETPLYNNYCMDADYHMTVTDRKSGEALQKDTVRLCIEQTDLITFGDLNKDRYTDIQIDMPSHQDETFSYKWWDTPFHMLWNAEKQMFEYKASWEVRSSLHANINARAEVQTGEVRLEYVVQSGDCLWSISKRFLGSGIYWTTLQRGENAPKDPDYLLPGEIVYIPNMIE